MKYSSLEERWNIATHASGMVLSVIGSYFLVTKSEARADFVGALIFGMSLLLLYTASTAYHATTHEDLRKKLRILDHAAIFVLIAGTYTPICLVSLWAGWGPYLLAIIWLIAVLGILLKLFFTGRYNRASTILYVAMGWIAVIAIKPLLEAFTLIPLLWLLAGGISYSIGAILYSIKKIPFNHAIFHVFVLLGSFCHYMMIYLYVIGND